MRKCRKELPLLCDTHAFPSGEGRENCPKSAAAGRRRSRLPPPAGNSSVTGPVYQISCIQRFGTLGRKRQVSSDGQETLLMSLPFGSILPVSERSHHEPNLCSVPVPVVWPILRPEPDHSSSIPSAHTGPSGLRDSDLSFAFAFSLCSSQAGAKRPGVWWVEMNGALQSSFSVITTP